MVVTNRAKRARSEAASSASGNKHLADNNVRRQITLNHRQWEYGRKHDDLHNIINNKRRLRARSPSPPWHSPAWATTPSGRGTFHALAPGLREVTWPDKFNHGPINKYDGSSNSKDFIQIYHMMIEAVVGDDRVKANYLPTILTSAVRSWLINLPEGIIYNWD
jgi:hypothetical protein